MKDELIGKEPDNHECGIVNLVNSSGGGTHHVAYFKNADDRHYFDSFGALPPREVINYLNSSIRYCTYQMQQFNETYCSERCLYILNKLNREDFHEVILKIIYKHRIY